MTVFGVGKIGKRIYDMVKGLGMDARAVDLRADTLSELYKGSVHFISKEEATDSDVIICAMNYTRDPASRYYNTAYFTEEYLRKFSTQRKQYPRGGRLYRMYISSFPQRQGVEE